MMELPLTSLILIASLVVLVLIAVLWKLRTQKKTHSGASSEKYGAKSAPPQR